MAENGQPATPPVKKYSTPKTVGHIKMQIIGDFKASTITGKIKAGTDGNADVTTDEFSSYAALEKNRAATSYHTVVAEDKRMSGKFYLGYTLPSVMPREAYWTLTMT